MTLVRDHVILELFQTFHQVIPQPVFDRCISRAFNSLSVKDLEEVFLKDNEFYRQFFLKYLATYQCKSGDPSSPLKRKIEWIAKKLGEDFSRYSGHEESEQGNGRYSKRQESITKN